MQANTVAVNNILFALSNHSMAECVHSQRKCNVINMLAQKWKGVEAVKKQRVTERKTATTMALRRLALQAMAVSYNSLDQHSHSKMRIMKVLFTSH